LPVPGGRAWQLDREPKGEVIVTDHEREEYRRQLVALAHRIRGDMTELSGEALRRAGGEASGNLSNMPLHLADLGTDAFEHEVTLGLLENESQVLQDIAAALDRMENGTYGQCELCGKEIDHERLKVLPYVHHCIACAHREQSGAASPAHTTGA
jgi:RNA polymerase-binding transcription factor DksA